jgi:hypothetical protein
MKYLKLSGKLSSRSIVTQDLLLQTDNVFERFCLRILDFAEDEVDVLHVVDEKLQKVEIILGLFVAPNDFTL